MIKILLPYIKLYHHYFVQILLGMSLAIVTLSASLFLLSLSGWFLAATAFVGVAGLYTFNYMLPAAGVRGAAIIRTAFRYFERLVNHDVTFKILAYLRVSAFKQLLPFSANQLQQYQKADLLNRFIADIDNLDHLYLKLFSPIISALIITLLLFIGISYFSLSIALFITLVLLATILILPLIFYHAGKNLGEKIAILKSQYRQSLNSYLQGQAELTLFNANQHYRTKLDQIESQWQNYQNKQATLANLAAALIVFIIGIMLTMVIYLVTINVPTSHPPLMALFIFITLSCGELLSPIPNAFIFLGQVLSSAKRMNEVMQKQPEIKFLAQPSYVDMSYGEIIFEQVKFSYPNSPIPVLKEININIKQGEHIALVGQTGCGKSTLLSLLTRQWQASSGSITINQQNIEHFNEQTLREIITVIPQSIDIFSDTLRHNLTIANPLAQDKALIEVLLKVGLNKLLLTEKGLDIWLGDGGRPLSGGERRRIGIARALLRNAPIILMDEPTESLDNQTEMQILSLIKEHYANKTIVMITHRLIDHGFFDRIFKLNKGTLSER